MRAVDLDNLSPEDIMLLNEVSDDLKEDFNALTADICLKAKNKFPFILNPAVSRNPYESRFYLNICYLSFVKAVYEREGALVVSVSSFGLKRILRRRARAGGWQLKVQLSYKSAVVNRLKDLARPLYDLYQNLLLSCMQLRSRNKDRLSKFVSKERPLVLLDTFILQKNIDQGNFSDRYYPGLSTSVPEEYLTDLVFVPTIIGTYTHASLNQLCESRSIDIFIKQDLLKRNDFWRAFTQQCKRPGFVDKKFSIRGFDVSALVLSEVRKNRFSGNAFRGILDKYFFKRLAETGIDLKLIIDWYENQPIDKGFNLGARTYFPKTPTKGYKGYIISEDYNFYVNPTDYEIDLGVIPDTISVIGKGFEANVNKYAHGQKTEVAPAFRFAGVHAIPEAVSASGALVALPIGYKEAFEIVSLLIATIRDYQINDFEFRLKPHPAMDMQKLRNALESSWTDNLKIVDGNFTTRLLESQFLISSTSSACVESLAMGVPVIILGSQSNLTQNPIPKKVSSKVWCEVYTTKELSEGIDHFVNAENLVLSEISQISHQIRESYFEKVSIQAVERFLNLY